MIFPHTCEKCGKTCEPGLIEIGQVLIVNCGNCLAHIRYGHVNEYPMMVYITYAIWDLLLHNQEVAEKMFNGRNFTKIMYWQAYRILINKVEKGLDRITHRNTFAKDKQFNNHEQIKAYARPVDCNKRTRL